MSKTTKTSLSAERERISQAYKAGDLDIEIAAAQLLETAAALLVGIDVAVAVVGSQPQTD